MNMQDTQLSSIYLKPGEIYAARDPALVQTVLGSCVSVTLFDPVSGTGAMCHGFLPRCANACPGECPEIYKYVDCCIRQMVREICARGARRRDIQAKLFGGADLAFSSVKQREDVLVGRKNIETAVEVLSAEGLRLITHDVGGRTGRKIFFYAHTGEVFLKRLVKEKSGEERMNGLPRAVSAWRNRRLHGNT